MGLINWGLVREYFTNNFTEKIDADGDEFKELTPVLYRWTHGATDKDLGDGLLIYSAIQYMRAKTCVCLGSGGGFIPRLMSQARMDLHDHEIFTGKKQMEWGDIGTTILVDACNGINGVTDWPPANSFLRTHFGCKMIIASTEYAFYNYFVKEDIKIDYLHIDAGHSYENVKQDFDLYSTILSENGIISIHDTDASYEKEHIKVNDFDDEEDDTWNEYSNGPSQVVKEIRENPEWEVFNFFNNGILREKPASTGLTFIQRCKK